MKFRKTMHGSLVCSVSTLAVEWIEIGHLYGVSGWGKVSTLAVEWIEIDLTAKIESLGASLHPRGGVD